MQKILVIRFSSIGDIVLTTPVLRALKEQLGAEVHIATKKNFQGVLSANPNVDRIWAIDKKTSEILPDLKKQGFTVIIDLHNNLRSRQIAWGLWKVPCYRFDKINVQKWLLTNWKIDRMPNTHIVDRYLAAATPLGITNDGKGLDHYIPQKEVVKITDWLPANAESPFYALVIGAAHATKRLPKEKIIEVAKNLKKPVVLIGGPSEKAIGEEIAAAAGTHCINTCGKLSLHGSASMIQQAAVVVTHDTGMMHIAAAFQRPIVSIWGNTVPAFGMYPYLANEQENVMIEVPDLPCRPCSKIGYQDCPKGHFKCMRTQKVDQIVQAATNLPQKA